MAKTKNGQFSKSCMCKHILLISPLQKMYIFQANQTFKAHKLCKCEHWWPMTTTKNQLTTGQQFNMHALVVLLSYKNFMDVTDSLTNCLCSTFHLSQSTKFAKIIYIFSHKLLNHLNSFTTNALNITTSAILSLKNYQK